MPEVHYFRSTGEAYDRSQTGYTKYPTSGPNGELTWEDLNHGTGTEVEDGDILVVKHEAVVGYMNEAWPVAITSSHGEFHLFKEGAEQKFRAIHPESFAIIDRLIQELGF